MGTLYKAKGRWRRSKLGWKKTRLSFRHIESEVLWETYSREQGDHTAGVLGKYQLHLNVPSLPHSLTQIRVSPKQPTRDISHLQGTIGSFSA